MCEPEVEHIKTKMTMNLYVQLRYRMVQMLTMLFVPSI